MTLEESTTRFARIVLLVLWSPVILVAAWLFWPLALGAIFGVLADDDESDGLWICGGVSLGAVAAIAWVYAVAFPVVKLLFALVVPR